MELASPKKEVSEDQVFWLGEKSADDKDAIVKGAPKESLDLVVGTYAPLAFKRCPHNKASDTTNYICLPSNYGNWEGAVCGQTGIKNSAENKGWDSHRLDLQSLKTNVKVETWGALGEPPKDLLPSAFAQWQVQFGHEGQQRITNADKLSLSKLIATHCGCLACVYMAVDQVFTLEEFRKALTYSYLTAKPVIMVSSRKMASEKRIGTNVALGMALTVYSCLFYGCEWASGIIIDFGKLEGKSLATHLEQFKDQTLYCKKCVEADRPIEKSRLEQVTSISDEGKLFKKDLMQRATDTLGIKVGYIVTFRELTRESLDVRLKIKKDEQKQSAKLIQAERKAESAAKSALKNGWSSLKKERQNELLKEASSWWQKRLKKFESAQQNNNGGITADTILHFIVSEESMASVVNLAEVHWAIVESYLQMKDNQSRRFNGKK